MGLLEDNQTVHRFLKSRHAEEKARFDHHLALHHPHAATHHADKLDYLETLIGHVEADIAELMSVADAAAANAGTEAAT